MPKFFHRMTGEHADSTLRDGSLIIAETMGLTTYGQVGGYQIWHWISKPVHSGARCWK